MSEPKGGTGRLEPDGRGELVAAVAELARRGDSFAAIGQGSTLGLGAPPGPVAALLSTARLARITRFAAEDLTCGVEPGVRLGDLLGELHARRLALAPGPAAPDRTLAGLFAESPPTSRGFDRADWRSQLIGVRAVDAMGREFKAGGNVVKNVAGYDIGKLFVGSGGAFFVAVELQLRLVALPDVSSWLASKPLERAAAAELWMRLRRLQSDLMALDLVLEADGGARLEALVAGAAALVSAVEKAVDLPVVASGADCFDRAPGRDESPPIARGRVPPAQAAAFAAALPRGASARLHLQGAFTVHGRCEQAAVPSGLPPGTIWRPLCGAAIAAAPALDLTRRLKQAFGAALAPQRASFDTRL